MLPPDFTKKFFIELVSVSDQVTGQPIIHGGKAWPRFGHKAQTPACGEMRRMHSQKYRFSDPESHS
jgi:hypothetical protein